MRLHPPPRALFYPHKLSRRLTLRLRPPRGACSEFFEEVETTIGAAFLTKSLALEECTVKMEVRARAGAAPRARKPANCFRWRVALPLPPHTLWLDEPESPGLPRDHPSLALQALRQQLMQEKEEFLSHQCLFVFRNFCLVTLHMCKDYDPLMSKR